MAQSLARSDAVLTSLAVAAQCLQAADHLAAQFAQPFLDRVGLGAFQFLRRKRPNAATVALLISRVVLPKVDWLAL